MMRPEASVEMWNVGLPPYPLHPTCLAPAVCSILACPGGHLPHPTLSYPMARGGSRVSMEMATVFFLTHSQHQSKHKQ